MHKVRTLIVGQAPSDYSKNPVPWRSGSSSRRLWGWFGCKTYEDFCTLGESFYAIPWLEGKNEKGDKVPSQRKVIAKLKKRLWEKIDEGYSLVFLVGKFPQRLAGMTGINTICGKGKLFSEKQNKYVDIVLLPHPSGVNLMINGKDEMLKDYVKDILRHYGIKKDIS